MANNKYASAVFNNPNEKSFSEPIRATTDASLPKTTNKYATAVFHPKPYSGVKITLEEPKAPAKSAIVKPTTGPMSPTERYKQEVPAPDFAGIRKQNAVQNASSRLFKMDDTLMGQAVSNAKAATEQARQPRAEEIQRKLAEVQQQRAQDLQAKITELQHQQDVYFDANREAELEKAKRDYANVEETLQKTSLAADTVGKGAGMFNQGAANFADFVSNAIPRVEGWLMGVEPEETFTGQLLKPATKATGAVKDYVDTTVAKIDENAAEKIGDSKAKQTAYNLGSGTVAALPQAVLAMMTMGGSTATQLPAQSSGLVSTVSNALKKAMSKPTFKLSFAQQLGSDYEEAKTQGATDMEAMVSATISSYVNALIESSGGIDELPGEIRDLDLTTPQKAWRWVVSMLDEGKEGAVQNVVTQMTNKGIFAEDTPLISATDENAVFNPKRMVKDFASEAAVGGILGGGQVLVQSGINAATKTDSRYNEMMRDLDSIMPRLPQEQSAASQTAQEAAVPNTPNTAPTETNVAQGTADDAVSAVLPNVAEHRDTATQILNDGIFDSPTYGDALEQTGMKRSDVRQALRKIAQNTPGADADAEVRAVVNAIVNAEAQTAVEPEAVEAAQEVPVAEAQQTVEAEQPGTAEANPAADEADDMGANPAMGAADSGFDPYSHASIEHGAIPPGENPARVVDVPKSMDGESNVMQTVRTIMEADATPDAAIPELEQAIVKGKFSKMPITDQAASERAESTIRQVGYQQALADWRAEVRNGKVSKDSVAMGETLYNAAVNANDYKSAVKIAVEFATQVRSAAQALQAVRMLKKMSPAAQLYGIKQSVDNLKKTLIEKFGSKAPNLTISENLAANFLAATDEQSRNDAQEAIYKEIAKQMPTTFGEIASQWRYTAMLLNPSTHIKNLAGNTTQLAEATIKDAIATVGEIAVDAASKVLRKGKGIERTKAFLNLASEADRALLNQASADYANVVDEIQGTGKYKNTADSKINEYRDIMKLNNPEGKVAKAVDATLRGIGKVSDFNSNLMDVEDRWFSQPRYAATLASYMKANGLTEITDDARAYAIKEAQKSTYRDVNAISEFAKSMGHGKFKLWNGIVNSIFPFKATPANVGVRAVEYSPVGLLTTLGKAARDVRRGEFKAANFIDDLSANITGTALAAVGILLAQQGVLRAKGTGDEKEKEQAEREGYKQNSITVFDHSVPISAVGAGSIPLLFGAAVYENFIADNPDGEGHTFDEFLDAFSGTLDPVMETTMLSGVRDAMSSFQDYDPDAGDFSVFVKGGIDVAANYVASFIPSLLSKVANATDTAARQTYIDKNKDAQKLQGEVQAWQKKVPGLRNQMTAQIDAYGNEVAGGWPTEGNAAARVAKAVAGIITPTYPSKIKTTAVDEELRRIYDNTTLDKSNTPVFTNDAPKSFEVKGETVYLTGEQYDRFAKTRNSSIQRIQSDVMSNEMYADMSVEVQHRAMHDAKAYAEALAKAELGVGYQLPDKWMEDLAGASPEVVAQTILERSVTNEAESNRYKNKFFGLESLLDNGSIDDQLALACMSNSANEAYMTICKDAGISVQQFLDAYGHASLGGEKPADKKQAALDYIDTLGLDSKTASKLALGVHTAIGTTMKMDTQLPDDYLLEIGATEQFEAQMSKTQKEDYDAYIKGKGVNLKVYQSAWEFYNSDESKGEKDKDGKDIKGKTHRDKVVDYIAGLKCSDDDKDAIFLALGYSEKNLPKKWK